jgi:hypothetical protein
MHLWEEAARSKTSAAVNPKAFFLPETTVVNLLTCYVFHQVLRVRPLNGSYIRGQGEVGNEHKRCLFLKLVMPVLPEVRLPSAHCSLEFETSSHTLLLVIH